MRIEESALAVVRALERIGVRYFVGGSLASSIHGEPRATNDADLVAFLKPQHFEALQRELGSRFYLDREDFEAAVKHGRSFNLIDEVELGKVDVFCVSEQGHEAEALARASRRELERGDPFSEATVASAEDVVVAKLNRYRKGGEVSDRQWADLKGLVAAQADALDLTYVCRWCRHFETEDLVERLLAQRD